MHEPHIPSVYIYTKKKEGESFDTPSQSFNLFVGLPGLEPGKTGPESVVLPLHHSPIYHQNHPFRF